MSVNDENQMIYSLVAVFFKLDLQGNEGWDMYWCLVAYWDRELGHV